MNGEEGGYCGLKEMLDKEEVPFSYAQPNVAQIAMEVLKADTKGVQHTLRSFPLAQVLRSPLQYPRHFSNA